MTGKYRSRRINLRDGREVTLRAMVEADATEMEGLVIAENTAMLARTLKFKVELVPGDATVLRVQRAL